MKELNDATLDFSLVVDCNPDGRISVRSLDYRPSEREHQTATDDSQTSTLLIMHQLDH